MPDPLPGERLAGSAPQSQSQSPVSAPPARSEPRAPRWQLWRSPPGQPAGAWPLLLLAAALAGLAYGRGMALPQVIEGVLAVLVLYRAVRRLAGPLVLAADATSAALSDGKLRWLLMAAPAERWRTRIGHVAAAGVVTVLVSLSWMTAVFVVPAHDRPYADGSRDDSLYEQVFGYNGLARPKDRRSARPATGQARSGPGGRRAVGLLAALLALAARWGRETAFMRQIEQLSRSRILLGVDNSALAASDILVSGREVQPIGGYMGGVPPPRRPPCAPRSATATCTCSCCPSGPRARIPGCAGSRRIASS